MRTYAHRPEVSEKHTQLWTAFVPYGGNVADAVTALSRKLRYLERRHDVLPSAITFDYDGRGEVTSVTLTVEVY